MKLIIKQHLPTYGEIIFYSTKYHINIHCKSIVRKRVVTKYHAGDTAHFDAEYSRRILYEVEEAYKYSKANKSANIKCESENV